MARNGSEGTGEKKGKKVARNKSAVENLVGRLRGEDRERSDDLLSRDDRAITGTSERDAQSVT